jgi:formylglycine-generating enzyme required for sulfatase activity
MVDDKPVRTVSLSSYAIQETEVTVQQFEQCVKAGSCATHDDLGSATSTWVKYKQGESGDRPINSLSYTDAKAYCTFAGARLCTEAEWEKAARGVDERCYPWGNAEPDCTKATMKDAFDSLGCGTGFVRDVVTDTGAGKSTYGAYDMAGNVAEWVSDWFGVYDAGELNDPTGPVSGDQRILRGGSYYSGPGDLSSYARWAVLEGSASSTNGVRCCWSP